MAEQDHGARSQGRRERRWSGSPWKQGLTTRAVPAGTAVPMPRTGSADMDGLNRQKQPGKGPQNPRKVKEHSQLQAKEHTQPQGKNWSYW